MSAATGTTGRMPPDAVVRPDAARTFEQISRVPYLPALDGMRALAVVAVMLYHANSDWLPGGFLGVEVFFVISGYLITLLLIAEKERSGGVDMKHFWIRRARRLLPALFAMMLAVTVLTALLKSSELGKLRGDVVAGLFYVSNWYQIWTGAGYTAANDFAPLRHLWSLAVEEQYYIVWPLVMVLLLRVGSRRVAGLSRWLFLAALGITLVMALLYYPGPIGTPEVTPDAYWTIAGRDISKTDALYLSTPTRAGGLLLGAAFAMIWRPVAVMRGPMRRRGPLLDLVAVVGLAALAAMAWWVFLVDESGADPWLFRGGFFLCGLATLGVIAAATHRRTVSSKLLATPVLLWIGTRSYGLYLYHWPIFQFIRDIAGKKLLFHEFVLAMVATAIVTELSYRFIETPIRKGTVGAAWRRMRRSRDPGQRRAVLVGAAVGTALTIFAGTSLATAELQQNEVEQSLDAGSAVACDVTTEDCFGTDGTDAAAGAGADSVTADTAGTDATGATGDAAEAGAGQAATGEDPTTEGATDTSVPPAETTTTAPAGAAQLALGDSVMLGAAGQLSELGFVVDAQESRAFINGLDTVLTLQSRGQLPEQMVIHLGTNGPIGQDDMDRMMEALAEVPEVLLLTVDVPRDYTAGNNALIYDTVNRYPNVSLLDWQGLVDSCPGDCLYSDGFHLRPEGQEYYASLIAGALGLE